MHIRSQLLESLSEKSKTKDFWSHLLIYLCMGFIFWPLTTWLAQTTQDQNRLLNALIVLGFATLLLIKFSGATIHQPFTMSKWAIRGIYICFGILVAQFALRIGIQNPWISLLSIIAYVAGLTSVLIFIFGVNLRHIILTTTGTFGVFVGLSTMMQQFDWPLRALAGRFSGVALEAMGKSVLMGVLREQDMPDRLILLVNDIPFHVASECNGFGVILSCILIACLLSIYRKHRPLQCLLNLLIGIILGFTFNTLRIIIIVLLAPHMMQHYDLMHETVGTLSYWSALIVAWWLLKGPLKYPSPAKTV